MKSADTEEAVITAVDTVDLSEDKLYRVYGSDNSFLGIGAFHEGSFRSFKNF